MSASKPCLCLPLPGEELGCPRTDQLCSAWAPLGYLDPPASCLPTPVPPSFPLSFPSSLLSGCPSSKLGGRYYLPRVFRDVKGPLVLCPLQLHFLCYFAMYSTYWPQGRRGKAFSLQCLTPCFSGLGRYGQGDALHER